MIEPSVVPAAFARRALRWRRALAVGAVALGLLAMHVFAGGTHAAAGHSLSTETGHHAPLATGADGAALTGGLESRLGCDPATVCLFLVGFGLALHLAARSGRPLVERRAREVGARLVVLARRARMLDPPDLHSLSILRC